MPTLRPILAAAALLTLGLVFTLAGCSEEEAGRTVVRVASTTSLYDTGLLDELVPTFHAVHPEYAVQVLAVGTGEALALGERRDADLLLVHAPEREREFLEAGHGLRRTTFMRNDFVFAGPAADPAGIAQATDAVDALRQIEAAGAAFASRGDDSGTHIRERTLWREAGIEPSGEAWYFEVGQGMGATLLFAGERRAYTLADRATLTVLRANGVELAELFAGGSALTNVYSIVPVEGALAPEGAAAFEAWLLGPEAVDIIRDYGREHFGRPLFALVESESVPAGESAAPESGPPAGAAARANADPPSRAGNP